MDTVVWNLSTQDQRYAYPGLPPGQGWGGNPGAPHEGYLAALQHVYSGGGGGGGGGNAPPRSPAIAPEPMRPSTPHSPMMPVMPDSLAGQEENSAWAPNTILQAPLAPDMAVSPGGQVETPMISVRAASPSSKDSDAAALMGLLGSSPRPLSPGTPQSYPSDLHRLDTGASNGVQEPGAPSVSLPFAVAPGKDSEPGAPMQPALSQPALGNTNQFVPQESRRKDSAQLRNFLKLDVDMGFVNDGTSESPTTMLQPTFGWKKRRSVSDVGPRTPSIFGPSMDTQVVSPMDDMAFLMPEASAPTPKDIPSPAPNDAALDFASLNLHVGEDASARSTPARTPHAADARAEPAARRGAPTLRLSTTEPQQGLAAPTPQVPSPVTLDPTLIQNAQLMHSLGALPEPMFAEPAGESSTHTGPIRPKVGTRTARSASPYQAPPSRSLTPDPAGTSEEAAQEAQVRMAQWRFPGTAPSPAPGMSLHPMDAYSRAGLDAPASRMPSHARGRRHMRAALSEDFHARERLAPWGHSFDLSREPLSPFALSPTGSAPGSQPGSRAVSPDVALWAAKHESQMLQARSEAASPTPSDAAHSSFSSAPQLSPGSSTSASSPEGKTVQTAAQTRTPVVTTSAAQAASALRRKTEALFTCPFPDCGSTFTRQYNLRGHMRSHMDQRPFKCDWPGCGRSFARTHDCKRHHNLHLNIKPYSCESCGKTFARLDALNRHHKSEAGSCGAHSEGRDSSNTPSERA
ncbi:hypothetical protein MOBT1_003388 [Malassezia obtusa]|uniref:C2H2-type domain-containing protein n=1 Tax=Malassezia obtusa TaxID=76774 RepID=A0AAF0E2Y0_9BASI|nr:hypothetical protein MOBT1_003388 [Malassezia obtusa]